MTSPVTPVRRLGGMKSYHIARAPQVTDSDWVPFPGGELEAPRPKSLCPSCREKLRQTTSVPKACFGPRPTPLCFACYRASLERERALKAAGELDTASVARFQGVLPLEPVNRSRLQRLQMERATSRATQNSGAGRYVDRRRHAQIEARHALERIVLGLRERHGARESEQQAIAAVGHAAELQVPDAWLPFVLAR